MLLSIYQKDSETDIILVNADDLPQIQNVTEILFLSQQPLKNWLSEGFKEVSGSIRVFPQETGKKSIKFFCENSYINHSSETRILYSNLASCFNRKIENKSRVLRI